MHFQVFVPATEPTDSPPAELLRRVGLESIATDFDALSSFGPEGKHGTLFGWTSPRTPHVLYAPERQHWRPAAKFEELPAGRYWVGLDREKPPTPQDLRRPYQQPGSEVALGGHDWLIPIARELEATWILADDGTSRFEPQRQFAAFSQQAAKYLLWFIEQSRNKSAEDLMLPLDELVEFAIAALTINYRFTREVISELQLLTNNNANRPLLAVLGAYQARRGGPPRAAGR